MKKLISAIMSVCVMAASMSITGVQAQEIKGTEVFFDDFSSSEMKAGWSINNTTEGNIASVDVVNGNFILEKSLDDNASNVGLTYKLETPISGGIVDIEMTIKATSADAADIQLQYRGDDDANKYHTMYRLNKGAKIASKVEDVAKYENVSNDLFNETTAIKFKSSINYDTKVEKNNVSTFINGKESSIKRGFITSTNATDNSLKYIRIYIPKSAKTGGLIIDDFRITHYNTGCNGNFEDFSSELDSAKWTVVNKGTTGNIAEINASEQNFRLNNAEKQEVGLSYKLDSAKKEGKVATEFTIRVNEKADSQVQVMLRNAADQNLAYMRLQIGGIPELQNAADTSYQKVGSSKLDVGVPVRIKVVFDYDAPEGENVTVFVDGTEVANKIGFKSADKGIALDDVYIKIAGAHMGVDVSIDDFHVYEIGGVAEKLADTYNKIDLGNTMAVAENLNLLTVDEANGASIAWSSDNEAVISSNGVLGGDKGTANLTASITLDGNTVTRNFIVKPFEYSYFENFDHETKPSGWSGGSIDAENKAFLTNVSGDTRYTWSSPISSGKFAVEFDMSKQNEGAEYVQFKFQNSEKKDIFLMDTQNGVRVRDVIEGTTKYHMNAGTDVVTGEWINVKLICDFTKESEQVSVFINGTKTNYDVSFFNEAVKDVKYANFYIPTTQVGAKYLIDNFKAYSLGGVAEATALGTALGFDKANVTKNITLPGSVEGGTVVWTSSNEVVISNDGIVTRPTDNDAEVVLTRVVTVDNLVNKTDFRVTVPADKGTVEYVGSEFTDNSGMPTLLVADKAVKGGFKINNDSDNDVTAAVITALYSEDELIDVKIAPVTVKAGETDVSVESNTVTIPSDASNFTNVGIGGEQNYEVRSFLFTSMKDLVPLTNGILLK